MNDPIAKILHNFNQVQSRGSTNKKYQNSIKLYYYCWFSQYENSSFKNSSIECISIESRSLSFEKLSGVSNSISVEGSRILWKKGCSIACLTVILELGSNS